MRSRRPWSSRSRWMPPDASDGLQLRVRCGVHAGVIERRDGDYFGSAVNRAARIMNAAHGGQVLASQAVAELVQGRLPDGMSLRDLGALRLRDLAGAEHVFQVQHAGLRRRFRRCGRWRRCRTTCRSR